MSRPIYCPLHSACWVEPLGKGCCEETFDHCEVHRLDSPLSSDEGVILSAEVTAEEMLNSVKLRLAQQYAPLRWRAWFDAVAGSVEQGAGLEQAIGKVRAKAPRELGAIADSAMLVGDPAQLLLDSLRNRIELRRSWRALWVMLIYPCVTLVFAVAIGTMFSSIMDFEFLQEFGLRGADEALAAARDQKQAMYGLAFVIGWTLLTVATVAILGPAWALTALLGGVRIFGRPLRWMNLSEILHRYHLFVSQGLGTVDAAEAVTRSFSASAQRYAAAGIQRRVQQGMNLGDAIAASSLSDSLCRPALRLLDYRGGGANGSLNTASQLLQHLVDQRCRSLSGVIPVLVLFIVGSVIWSILSCYILALLPLVSMITSLA